MFSEDNKVLELMADKGIQNVRGGTYSQVNLEPATIEHLEKQLRHASEECFRCGRDNHFVKDCYATTDVLGNPLDEIVSIMSTHKHSPMTKACLEDISSEIKAVCESLSVDTMTITSHKKDTAEAYNDLRSRVIEVAKCLGKLTTLMLDAYFYKVIVESLSSQVPVASREQHMDAVLDLGSEFESMTMSSVGNPLDETVCRRCGRDNHSSGSCYASTHVHGYLLKASATGSAAAARSRREVRNGEKPLAKKRADKKTDPRLKTSFCHRCGRGSHRADSCYASTHIDGYQLDYESKF